MDKGRSGRDRELFDRVAVNYARKDLLPAMRVARRHRARSTWPAPRDRHAKLIVDVGCGAGFAAAYLDDRYGTYTGLDYSAELIDAATTFNAGPNRLFRVEDATTFSPDEPPDVVFMVGALHHMPDPRAALAHFLHILAPGGWLVANEPQSANPMIQLARRIRGRLDPSYSDEQDQYDPGTLADLAEQVGFEDVSTNGQGLFSTPFAEVPLPGQRLLSPLVRVLVGLDSLAERVLPGITARLAWNTVLRARKPEAS